MYNSSMMNTADDEDAPNKVDLDAMFDQQHAFGGADDSVHDNPYGLQAGKKLMDFNDVVDMDVVEFHLDDHYVKKKWRNDCIKFGVVWFVKHILFILIVFALCFVGGYLFRSLEEENDVKTCKSQKSKYQDTQNTALQAILSTAQNFQLSKDERQTQFSSTLNEFTLSFARSGWNGEDCDDMTPRWALGSATYFCVTVATSIGYGHVTPKTQWGQATLIALALIVVPLTLASFANLGAFFSQLARYTYSAFCCCGTCRKFKGEVVVHTETKKRLIEQWRAEVEQENQPGTNKKKKRLPTQQEKKDMPAITTAFIDALEDTTDSDDDDSDADLGGQEVEFHEAPVPTPVALLILVSVIFFGASIFSATEDWSFLDAVYFSFISTATIGFGDLVPGAIGSNTDTYVDWKFAVLALFNFFSIGMLAACLGLIQENVRTHVSGMMAHFLAKKKRIGDTSSSSSGLSGTSSSDEEIDKLPIDSNAKNQNFFGMADSMYEAHQTPGQHSMAY